MDPPIDQMTTDGYDLQFGTNVLGHWYFTELLLPALEAGAKSSTDGYARVATTSSSGAHFAKPVDFETFREHPNRQKLGINLLYCQSKLVSHGLVSGCMSLTDEATGSSTQSSRTSPRSAIRT